MSVCLHSCSLRSAAHKAPAGCYIPNYKYGYTLMSICYFVLINFSKKRKFQYEFFSFYIACLLFVCFLKSDTSKVHIADPANSKSVLRINYLTPGFTDPAGGSVDVSWSPLWQ